MIPIKNNNVLVCPLDWGLGHAARCIPIINELTARGANVIIAASGRASDLLRLEFPKLHHINFKGFSPSYPVSGNMAGKMLRSLPSFIYQLITEKYRLSEIIKVHKIDIVISDNRYGLINKNTFNVILIHQIRIKVPRWLKGLEPFLSLINRSLISRFDHCWIPDFADEDNLSGELSHSVRLPKNASYIGPLSRFQGRDHRAGTTEPYLLVLLSGPEPQRSLLENIIITQMCDHAMPVILIGGKTEESGIPRTVGNLTIYPYATEEVLFKFLVSASLIICRPGYSTIMDLAATAGKALFVPTPGQTEQEYLGELFMSRGIAFSVPQKNLELSKNITHALTYKGFTGNRENAMLMDHVDMLLAR